MGPDLAHSPQHDELAAGIAREIFALMGRHRVTQARLCRVLGVSQPTLSKHLRGHVAWKIDQLEQVAAFFGKDIVDLLPPRRAVELTLHTNHEPLQPSLPFPHEYDSKTMGTRWWRVEAVERARRNA